MIFVRPIFLCIFYPVYFGRNRCILFQNRKNPPVYINEFNSGGLRYSAHLMIAERSQQRPTISVSAKMKNACFCRDPFSATDKKVSTPVSAKFSASRLTAGPSLRASRLLYFLGIRLAHPSTRVTIQVQSIRVHKNYIFGIFVQTNRHFQYCLTAD